MSKHTYRTKLEVIVAGLDMCVDELVIEFTYTPGKADTYDEQGYGPEIYIERVSAFAAKTLKPLELPQWLVESLDESESLRDELCEYATGEIEHWRDEAADRRRELRDERMGG